MRRREGAGKREGRSGGLLGRRNRGGARVGDRPGRQSARLVKRGVRWLRMELPMVHRFLRWVPDDAPIACTAAQTAWCTRVALQSEAPVGERLEPGSRGAVGTTPPASKLGRRRNVSLLLRHHEALPDIE